MAVSSFLPWLTASAPILFGMSLSRTGLEFAPETAWFALLFFAIGSLAAWFYGCSKKAGIACLIMSITMLLETIYDYSILQQRITSFSTEYVLITISTGFYLLGIGVIVSLTGSVLLLRFSMRIQEQPPMLVTRICPQCHKPLEEEARFCPYCGQSVQ
jgi:hypothetical protein